MNSMQYACMTIREGGRNLKLVYPTVIKTFFLAQFLSTSILRGHFYCTALNEDLYVLLTYVLYIQPNVISFVRLMQNTLTM